MLELLNIYKTFNPNTAGENKLFEDFSLKVNNNEFVSVVGNNGSGKTTVLNFISGSIPVDGGKIILDGNDITNLKEYQIQRKIGRVYQDPSVGTIPDMTIYENMALAYNKGKKYNLTKAVNKSDYDYFREQISLFGLGLEDKMNNKVGILSGGQRQALSLIMSTLTDIDLLLLDEHTAALDPKTAETIMVLTDKIIKDKKLTAIMVTHNLRYAINYGTRLIMLHEGKILLDRTGKEKENTTKSDLLNLYE